MSHIHDVALPSYLLPSLPLFFFVLLPPFAFALCPAANFAQGFSILMALIIGLPVPLTPIQVLYVNMITSGEWLELLLLQGLAWCSTSTSRFCRM